MRYGKNGKIYITGGPDGEEGEMVRMVKRQYVTAEEFLVAIGIDFSILGKPYNSPPATMLGPLIKGARGFEPHQWEKLNELYEKLKHSQPTKK
jgi:hypothetical protein